MTVAGIPVWKSSVNSHMQIDINIPIHCCCYPNKLICDNCAYYKRCTNKCFFDERLLLSTSESKLLNIMLDPAGIMIF